MKPRLFFTLGLFAVFLLSACAPVGTDVPTQAPVTPTVEASITPLVAAASSPTLEATAQPPADAVPIVTSRGPDLHATDPATVSLASGQIQFVEFFRFT